MAGHSLLRTSAAKIGRSLLAEDRPRVAVSPRSYSTELSSPVEAETVLVAETGAVVAVATVATSPPMPTPAPIPHPPLPLQLHPLQPGTPWSWTCHICGSKWRLSATNRCLNDGHRFCSGRVPAGRPGERRIGEVRKCQACEPEFDYQFWQLHRERRRMVFGNDTTDPRSQICQNQCAYPGECQHRKRGLRYNHITGRLEVNAH